SCLIIPLNVFVCCSTSFEPLAVRSNPFPRAYSFFFSSRRRHTRSKRDWSSDVCSSDLSHSLRPKSFLWDNIELYQQSGHKTMPRSEERRVGKECRARWSPCQ